VSTAAGPEDPTDSMSDRSSHPQRSCNASQPATSLVAALLGPLLAVLVYLALLGVFGRPIGRADLLLWLLVLALGFPGRNRFEQPLLPAMVGLCGAWIGLLAVLALAAVATSGFAFFDPKLLLWWALLTPLAQGLAVWAGQRLLRGDASRNRRTAVILGAGALGVAVARALGAGRGQGVDFVGYFDDRTDERLHVEAAPSRLGALKEAADYVREHAIHDVYITLPLGSQARIVELLKQVRDTAAAVYFVPDAFAIDIIRGRLQDVNGVSVVGIGQPPATGVRKLIQRISDAVLMALLLPLAAFSGAGLAGSGMTSSTPNDAGLQRKQHFGHDGGGLRVAVAGRLFAPGFADGSRPQFGAAPQAIDSAVPASRG
jgi:putative colanic acid biosynthesis UDP-glucose lipid carrier transferase